MRPVLPVQVLARADPGVRVRVVGVWAGDATELAREGLLPGSLVTVATRIPMGGPVVVKVGRARLALAAAVAGRIVVEPAFDEAVVSSDIGPRP